MKATMLMTTTGTAREKKPIAVPRDGVRPKPPRLTMMVVFFSFLLLLSVVAVGSASDDGTAEDGSCSNSDNANANNAGVRPAGAAAATVGSSTTTTSDDDDGKLCFPGGGCFATLDEADEKYGRGVHFVDLDDPVDFGDPQQVSGNDWRATMDVLARTQGYMRDVYRNETMKKYRKECKCRDKLCAFWSAIGT
jgi:hypothetical protein